MALAINDDHRALAEIVRSFAASADLRALTRAALDPGAGSGANASESTASGTAQPESVPNESVPPGTGSEPADPGRSWKQIGDLGWLGLHLPEDVGGSGFTFAELAIVAEGLGSVVASGPFLATVVASAVIDAVGTPDQRESLLPGLADGSVRASIAVSDGTPVPEGRGPLSGTSGPLIGGRWANLHLIPRGDDLVVLKSDADRLTTEPIPGIDPSLGLITLSYGGDVPTDALLKGGRAVALRVLRLVAAAEAAGAARACLQFALDYAKVREQFGRTIGSFQAIKHHLADMLVRAELATATAWDAARLGSHHPEAELAADVAAAVALDAYQRNARMNIQIHGGIGFTWEHDAHLYLRRAAALAALVGPVERAQDDVFTLTKQGVRRQYAVELPPEAEQFRRDAADFVSRYQGAEAKDQRRLLVESGYLVAHWQRPWGRAAGAVEQLVIEEELAGIELPNLGIGGWVLLTLTQKASAEQIERWVLPSLLGDLTWCQLFSEPNAGSDAAAVQTRGVKVDGGWRVTGQKVWTSNAQNCNRGLATIRTNPSAPKHKGITALAIDLTAVGVEVRPLRELTGDALFNEVFFDDVFIPDADVVGDVNGGWAVARATLGNERVTIGGGSREGISALDLAKQHRWHAPADGGLSRQVGRLVAQEQAMQLINLRQVERAVTGAEPSAEGNVTKLLSAEHAQAVTELGMSIAAVAGIIGGEAGLAYEYLFDRCLTIAGGTSEVSRNVIAERILGLPREIIPR